MAKTVKFVTTQPTSYIFNIRLRNENIRGRFVGPEDARKVEFDIPAEHVEAFEKSHHVTEGIVARVKESEPEAQKEPAKTEKK